MHSTRGKGLKLQREGLRLNIKNSFLARRVVKHGNVLPRDCCRHSFFNETLKKKEVGDLPRQFY